MELSCGDQSWSALPHASALELIRLLGFDRVDIVLGVNAQHLIAADVAREPRRVAEALGAELELLTLEVADVFIGPLGDFEHLCPNHPSRDVRDQSLKLFDGVLEFARHLGSPGVTQVPGIAWAGESHADSFRRAASELSNRAARAEQAGLSFRSKAISVRLPSGRKTYAICSD